MTLIGAFILPHGSIILDPSKDAVPVQAKELHDAMQDTVRMIEKLQPDLVFFSTPHGIALSHDFGIYMNQTGSGSAEWEGEYTDFKVKVEFDQTISAQLHNFLKKNKVAISGITTYSAGLEAPLRWGEVVPLWFLKDLPFKPKYLIMSQPSRRYEQAVDMIPELIDLGKVLKNYFDLLEKKVVVIISADLAHTHSASGPYKYSEIAEPFDNLIERWATTLNADLLLKNASSLLNQALCCGYTGFVILQGLLEGTEFQPKVLIRANPTYYGMLVAEYIKESP
ncbi:MAG: hypothetical protein ACFFCZ_16765 [Promethearchaeota archaeon]